MRAFCTLILFLPTCSQSESTLTPAAFDAQRAFQDLRYLVEEIGERRVDTKESAAVRDYVRRQLEPLGWRFEEQRFPVTPPENARRKGQLTGTNLLARRPGTGPGEIWLAGHYDTYDRPRFVGANDAGSSTAILVELGRQLAGDGPRPGPSLVLCWFDGEEPFHDLPWDDKTNSTFGSRYQVEKMQQDGTLQQVKALILLDMVGDKDLGITIESLSAQWLREVFESTAFRLGHKQLFVDRRQIKDDHMHFAHAGVPVIDLIDFRFGPGNAWWHTTEDTLDKCSPGSLEIVGKLVLTALPEIEKKALAASQ